MLVHNDVAHDARVRKTARTLAGDGYAVTVIGVARPDAGPVRTQLDGFDLWLLAPPAVPDARAERKEERVRARRTMKRAERAVVKTRNRIRAQRVLSGAWLAALLDLRRAYRARARARTEHAAALDASSDEKQGLRTRRREALTRAWRAALRELDPDVVHVHDFRPLEAGVRAGEELGIPVIYDAHEYVKGREEAAPAKAESWVAYEQRWAPMTDAVITVSDPLARLLREQLPLRATPTVIVNLPRLADREPPPFTLREAAGVGPDTPLAVYSGTANPRRGIDLVIDAVALVPGLHLALVLPDGKHYALELAEAARAAGIEERVHFAPFAPVESVVAYLAGADVGVYTPRDDGVNHIALPNKLFEYLHAGLPLVVTDLGVIGRFVRETGIGQTTDGSPAGTAAAIRAVLENPSRYAQDDELVRRWSWEAQGAKLLALYARLLGACSDLDARSDLDHVLRR